MSDATDDLILAQNQVLLRLLDNQPLETVLDYCLTAIEKLQPEWRCLFRGVDLAQGELLVLRAPEGLVASAQVNRTEIPCRHLVDGQTSDNCQYCEPDILNCANCSGCYDLAHSGFSSCFSMTLKASIVPDPAMLSIFVRPESATFPNVFQLIEPWLPLLRLIWMHWSCQLKHVPISKLNVPESTMKIMSDELLRCEQLAGIGSMVAGIAHELSTPVGNTILSMDYLQGQIKTVDEKFVSQSLKRQDLQTFFQEMHYSVDILAKNIQRISGLVHSFKQVAVDQCSERIRSFSLRQVIEDNWTVFQAALRGKKITLVLKLQPEDFLLESQPGALGQVITNLLNNAQTHAFEGMAAGEVTIEATLDARKRVTLSFADNGCGIPDVQHHLIFNSFFTTKADDGGSGLGLYLVHELIHRKLQGQIMVHSELGKGTTFVMNFPATLSEA